MLVTRCYIRALTVGILLTCNMFGAVTGVIMIPGYDNGWKYGNEMGI